MGISYIASAENDCLLDYAIATTPDPLQVSPQDGDASLATLTIAVSNGTPNPIYCKQIMFTIPIGASAQDLACEDTVTGIQVSASPSGQWQITADTNNLGSFVATPTQPNYGQIMGQGLVFQLYSIQVNQQVGTFAFMVTEDSSPDGVKYQTYSNTYNIAKFPYAFYVSDFVANTPQVQLGGTATLSWNGSDEADYTILYYDSSNNQQQKDVTSVRIWPTPALYSDTNFLLQVTAQSQGETVNTYLSAFVSVADPLLTATTLTVLQTTTLQGDTTIGSDLAVTGSLNVSQTSTLADTVIQGTLSSSNAVGVMSQQAQALFFAGSNSPITGQVDTDGFLLGQVGLPSAANSPASTIQISVQTADNQPLYTAYATGSDGSNPGPASLLLPVQKGCVWQTVCQGQSNPPMISFTWIPFGVGSTSAAVAINSGGGAAGTFLADRGSMGGGSSYEVTTSIDTSGVSNPAPQAVYQTSRSGSEFDYLLELPNGNYTTRLHFAEILFSGPGQRIFNVTCNGQPVLTNYDICAAAGASNKAVVESFTWTSSSNQGAWIRFFGDSDYSATLNGIETFASRSVTTAINAGGYAAGSFVADSDYSGGSTYSTGSSIDTSGVANPAPQAVYQTERNDANNFTYTIPNLFAANYIVRLHFAEIYYVVAGQRIFNVTLNGNTVLSNFDIFATAGAENKAIVEEFQATANNNAVVIEFQNVTGGAKVSGIEVLPSLS